VKRSRKWKRLARELGCVRVIKAGADDEKQTSPPAFYTYIYIYILNNNASARRGLYATKFRRYDVGKRTKERKKRTDGHDAPYVYIRIYMYVNAGSDEKTAPSRNPQLSRNPTDRPIRRYITSSDVYPRKRIVVTNVSGGSLRRNRERAVYRSDLEIIFRRR